jgi:dihydrofolate synthase/folylpolyglutamate synthase
MTYEQAIDYWFAHVNYEQRTPAAADLGLGRMRVLLSRLGDPHRRLRIVHVAGSKGKGSTAAMLAAILQRAGYRTGLFTSPHLCALEERFQVNSQPISRTELTALLDEVRQVSERPGGSKPLWPTFFEIATAVGFLHFVRRRTEAVVLEVGLGGRLDSTNVCVPLVSVLTSISFDHTRTLGNRLSSIAWEKAGIVKRGRPAISGVTVPEARAVIEETCRNKRAPLRQLGVDFHYRYDSGQVTDTVIVRPRVEVATRRRRWPLLELNLLGEHQAANAAVAIACVEVLREQGLTLVDEAVAHGLREVFWPARMEVVGRAPLIVLDCAHNVASAEAVVRTLETSFPPGRRVLVFAGSSDKDIPGMFRVLAPHFAQAFVTRYTNNQRAIDPGQLAPLWSAAGDAPVQVCATPTEALARAREAAGSDGLIGITGSVFLAGELRPHLVRAPGP